MKRRNMTKLLMALLTTATINPAAAMTKKERKIVAERIIQIIREKNLVKGKREVRMKTTETQAEAMLAAIKAGDKAAQERIVREIVAQPTTKME